MAKSSASGLELYDDIDRYIKVIDRQKFSNPNPIPEVEIFFFAFSAFFTSRSWSRTSNVSHVTFFRLFLIIFNVIIAFFVLLFIRGLSFQR